MKASGGRGKKGGLSEYAVALGKSRQIIERHRDAAEVAEKVQLELQVSQLLDKSAHLSAVHKLPQAEKGKWLPWCKLHLKFSKRTASKYLALYHDRDRIKSEVTSDLGIEDAYRLLSQPAVEPEVDARPDGNSMRRDMTTSLRACLAAEARKRLHPDETRGGNSKAKVKKLSFAEFAKNNFKVNQLSASQALAILNHSAELLEVAKDWIEPMPLPAYPNATSANVGAARPMPAMEAATYPRKESPRRPNSKQVREKTIVFCIKKTKNHSEPEPEQSTEQI